MPRPELSLRAAALGDKLLARLDPVTPRSIDDLLPWWERHGVLRVELVRLLRQLVEEGQVERNPDGYVLVTPGQKSKETPAAAPPAPAPPVAPPAPPPAPVPSGTVPRVVSAKEKEPRAPRAGGKPPPPEPVPARVEEEPPASVAPATTGPLSVGTGTLVSRVLDELARQPRTCAELLRSLPDSNPNTVRGALARLKSAGKVLLDDQGIYRPALQKP
jgi:DNA-binding HxlR family transcriptional regulator